MTTYLYENIMPYDLPNTLTLGFDPSDGSGASSSRHTNTDGTTFFEHESDSNAILRSTYRHLQQQFDNQNTYSLRKRDCVDGLSDGILNQTLHYSLLSKVLYPWADVIPHSIFMEYLVPFAIVNEPRVDYRPLLFDALREMLKEWEVPTTTTTTSDSNMQMQQQTQMTSIKETQTMIKEVVKRINTRLWSILGRPSKPIVFHAGLTPRIYDPLSVIAYGHSSCTGLAVLLIAALRSVGIAARLVGTPAWYGDEEQGNHSWLEVFIPDDNGGRWIFLEPTPGIAEGDEDTANADDLDRDPCKRWFCKADRFNGSTRVFATRYTKEGASTSYPMAWAVGDEGVVGEDRSEYYTDVCSKCS